jgi:hypothetical protein
MLVLPAIRRSAFSPFAADGPVPIWSRRAGAAFGAQLLLRRRDGKR